MILTDTTNTIFWTPTNPVDKWFIDLATKWDGWGMVLYVLLTVIIAAILSAAIGLERYRKGKSAGMRTHALLSVGCSLLMTVSIWAMKSEFINISYDHARIAAAAITGVGFLGAGVIVKDRFTIKGLSTATTLWIVSSIGLAIGAGFILEGVIAVIVAMGIILICNKVVHAVDLNAPHVTIEAKEGISVIERVRATCDKNSLNLKSVYITEKKGDTFTVKAYFPYNTAEITLDYFVSEIMKEEGIKSAEVVNKYHDHQNKQ